jgi:metal-dependent amidase/aminoacylase/carboxypeptidase family protein
VFWSSKFLQEIWFILYNLLEYAINAKTTKSFESRLDRHWKNQDNMYNYEANLTTGTEIKSDKEDEDLSKVVNDQCSEEDLMSV